MKRYKISLKHYVFAVIAVLYTIVVCNAIAMREVGDVSYVAITELHFATDVLMPFFLFIFLSGLLLLQIYFSPESLMDLIAIAAGFMLGIIGIYFDLVFSMRGLSSTEWVVLMLTQAIALNSFYILRWIVFNGQTERVISFFNDCISLIGELVTGAIELPTNIVSYLVQKARFSYDEYSSGILKILLAALVLPAKIISRFIYFICVDLFKMLFSTLREVLASRLSKKHEKNPLASNKRHKKRKSKVRQKKELKKRKRKRRKKS